MAIITSGPRAQALAQDSLSELGGSGPEYEPASGSRPGSRPGSVSELGSGPESGPRPGSGSQPVPGPESRHGPESLIFFVKIAILKKYLIKLYVFSMFSEAF